MTTLSSGFIASSDAARVLGIHPMSIQKLFQEGKLQGEKIANRWLVRRADVEEFAKTYVPKVGRPRTKRKYTKREPV